MKLSPLDIQQQQFRTSFWGFDRREVDAFLDIVASEMEELVRANKALTEELKRKEGEIQDHRERERTLKDTMITATRITEDIKENARKEAEIVVAQAETQAEQIIQNAHARLIRIMEDLDELRRQKAQFLGSLRSTITTHERLLEAMSEKESGAEAELLTMLGRRRPAAEAAQADDEVRPIPREQTVRVAVSAEDLIAPRGGDR